MVRYPHPARKGDATVNSVPIPEGHPTREALSAARRHVRRHVAERVKLEWLPDGRRVVILPAGLEGTENLVRAIEADLQRSQRPRLPR